MYSMGVDIISCSFKFIRGVDSIDYPKCVPIEIIKTCASHSVGYLLPENIFNNETKKTSVHQDGLALKPLVTQKH